MAPFKLLNLIALSTLAVLTTSFGSTGVVALSSGHEFHHVARGHDAIAKRKRTNVQKRCKNRPPPSASVTSSSSVAQTTSKSSSSPPKPSPTKDSGSNSGNTGDSKPGNTGDSKPGNSGDSGDSKPGNSGNSDDPKPGNSGSSDPKPGNSGSGGGSSAGTGKGKMGIAWPNGPEDNGNLHFYKTDATKFIYTWSPWCPQGAKALGFECAPMLWGDKHIDAFIKNVVNGPDSYANYILGMNEPNEPSQSNMSPGHAADVWKKYIQPLKSRGYQLISPACTNGPDGKQWMKDFMNACSGCTFDGVAVHFYGTSSQGLIDHVNDYYSTFNKPIWITEAACQDFSGKNNQCDKGQVFSFLQNIKNFAENDGRVATYFPFGVMHDMYNVNPLNQLMSGSGKPTDLGWTFLG